MARACMVCNHPRRAEFDAALTAGTMSQTAVAGEAGCTPSSVSRHYRNHLVPEVSAMVMADPELADMDVDILAGLRRLYRGIHPLLDRVLSAKNSEANWKAVCALNSETRNNLAMLAKLLLLLDTHRQVDVLNSAEYRDMRSGLTEGLWPFPQARMATTIALEAIGGPACTDLVYALDPVLWAQSLGFTPDDWQADVLRSTASRIVMLCSRQSGKSETAALVGLHTALYQGGSLVLLVSPSLRQSKELYRKITTWMARLENQPVMTEDTKTSCEFEGGSRIVCLPGTEATVRGFSAADLLIEDEGSRVDDDYYAAIRPMMAVSQGRLMILSTPWGKRGHFYEAWTEGENWQKVKITADQCPRITAEFLEEERDALGDWFWRQEYFCEFVELLSNYFTREEIDGAFTDAVKPLDLGVTPPWEEGE